MDYINKKNEIDTAKTNMYKSFSRLSKNGYVYELWNVSSVFTLTQNKNYVWNEKIIICFKQWTASSVFDIINA